MRKKICAAALFIFMSALFHCVLTTAIAESSPPPPASAAAAVSAESKGTGLAKSAAAELKGPEESRKISLDLKGMDIVEVIKMLAAKGNINVVVGSNVKGRVTIFLKSVDIMDAFEIILIANNLACDKRGDIINVMAQRDYEAIYGERYADNKAVKFFRLKFAKAADVSRALNQVKTKVGKVIVDEGSNTVVVIDSAA